ncbi:NnrS family protein [Microvirga sp. CF3016]|uniref:NnrS family protein n=1 Tax=Microvirga sp. CF3016 TaxID=3110181 RepID=UPI003FA5E4EC
MVSATGYEAIHARELLVGFVPILLIGFLSVALPRWTKRTLEPRGSLEVLLGCHMVAFVLECFDPRAGLLLHALAALVAAAVVAHHVIAARAYSAAYVAALVLVHSTAGTIVAGATAPDHAWLRLCLAAVVLLCLELGHRIARALIAAASERHRVAPLKPEMSSLAPGQRLSAVAALALWSLGLPCALPACIAGSLGFIRMFLLQPWRVHPMAGIAAVLAGVIWLNIGFMGLAIMPTTGYLMPDVAIIHMWSVGGLGTTATAVMTSITRKRDRTSFRPALLANLAYASIGFSVGMRLLAFAMVESSQTVLHAARLGWISAFSCCLVFVGIGSRGGTWRAAIGRADRLWKAAAGSPHAPACIPDRDTSDQACLTAAAVCLKEQPDSCVVCGSILPDVHGGWTISSPFEVNTGCEFALDQSRLEKACQHDHASWRLPHGFDDDTHTLAFQQTSGAGADLPRCGRARRACPGRRPFP